MQPSCCRPCHVRREGDAFLMIGTHVDDLFVLFNTKGERLKDEVWQYLNEVLTIKSMGDAVWTLQMSINRDPNAGVLKISQASFTREVIRRFNISTPASEIGDEAAMSENDLPSTPEEKEDIDQLPFLELIGCLWWLAQMTRPDIFVALQQASKWVARPSAKLWRWLTRIVRYLAGTITLGLVYRRDDDAPPLKAFVDAAYADTDQCKSTAGWVYLFRGSI